MNADVASAIGTVLSAFIAMAVWRASRNSAKAARALTKIESSRWHADLQPQFGATARAFHLEEDGNEYVVMVSLELEGPPSLQKLDRVTTSIRPGPEGTFREFTMEQPYRFPDGSMDDPVGRTNVVRGDQFTVLVQPTDFELRRNGRYWTPLPLLLTCSLEGHDTWSVPIKVNNITGDKKPTT